MRNGMVRMGGYQGEASVHTRAARLLGEAFVRATRGDPGFEFTADVTASGRPANDLFAMVEGEELDLCYFASSYLVHRVPELAVFDLPFTVVDRQRLYALLDGAFGEAIAGHVGRRTGFRVVGFWDNGFRHFSNWRRPIRHPGDCAGLRIRTMNNAIHQQTFAALGMDPAFIDVKDFPQAVRSHAVDAQENPLTNTFNFGVHETHRHVTMTGHFCGVALVLANAARFAAWPQPVRDALLAAMPAATQAQRQFAAGDDATCRASLEAAGVEVIGPEGFDREAFVAATRAVVEQAAKDLDPALLQALRG